MSFLFLEHLVMSIKPFCFNIIPPSTKFIQCQTTIRSTLKSSPSESITHLWKLTKNHTNIQYDQCSATKEVIKSLRDNQQNKLTNHVSRLILHRYIKILSAPSKHDLVNLSIQTPKKQFQLHHTLYKQFVTNPLKLAEMGTHIITDRLLNAYSVLALNLCYMLLLVAVPT